MATITPLPYLMATITPLPYLIPLSPMPSRPKAYARATLKKILKGHSNRNIGKGVDQLVRFQCRANPSLSLACNSNADLQRSI
jgi:hypothetical protein